MFRVVLIGLLCLLGGCTRPQIEHLSSSFNEAIANSSDEQLLLNAVRASLDQRMYFTSVSSFTGQGGFSGSIGPSLPFGSEAKREYDLGVSVDIDSGIKDITLGSANTSESNDDLNKDLGYSTFDRYLREGKNPLLLVTLMVEFFEVHKDLYDALLLQKDRVCRQSGKSRYCRDLDDIARECKDDIPGATALEEGEQFVTIANSAGTKCDFLQFQSFLYLLRMSELTTDITTTERLVDSKDKQGKPTKELYKETDAGIYFQNEEVRNVYKRIRISLKEKAAKNKGLKYRTPLKFGLRSPRAVVAYLGQLIALQYYSKERFVPTILLRDGKRLTIFRVLRSRAGGRDAVLSVHGPDGFTYYVPSPQYGSPYRDRTMRALTIAGELVDTALSQQPLPVPAVVYAR